MSNEYHFITRWRLDATVEEVDEVLGDALDLSRWWPAVAANHRWAMATGEKSLRLELARRRAATAAERAAVEPPPGPAGSAPWMVAGALVIVTAGLVYLASR